MGFFAMPLTLNEFLILGFAWGSWGEFSFILALRALRGNLLTGILADPTWKMMQLWVCHVGYFDKLTSGDSNNMYFPSFSAEQVESVNLKRDVIFSRLPNYP